MSEGPKKSVRRDVGGARDREFSSFDDLFDVIRREGEVRSIDDLITRRPDLLADILFRWYRQGQIACQYARLLALNPKDSGWASEIITPGFDVDTLTQRVDAAARQCEGLQLIFPGCDTPDEAARLVARLCQHPRWWCVEEPWEANEGDDCIAIGLRFTSGDGSYTSWVLAIAPFEPMPFTRRFHGAPFIALVFRPTGPADYRRSVDPVAGGPASHLAHMNDRLGADDRLRGKVETHTHRQRDELLGRDPTSAARAQVTMALPERCRSILDPVIRQRPALGAVSS